VQLTPHLTDADLALALDRDDGAASTAVGQHLTECESCREALDAAKVDEVEVAGLFRLLDHEAPDIDARDFVGRVAARRTAAESIAPGFRLWPNKVASWAVAAGILTASVAAAALVPNSPVRQFVRLVVAASPIGHKHSSIAPSGAVMAPPLPRGVAILPHGRVDVLFRSNQAAGTVRVIAATSSQLSVEGDGDGPTYTVGERMISIDNSLSDSAAYIVRVPAIGDADTVYIRIAGRVSYSEVGDRVTAEAQEGRGGQWLISLRKAQH
jgi:hypothetical protein